VLAEKRRRRRLPLVLTLQLDRVARHPEATQLGVLGLDQHATGRNLGILEDLKADGELKVGVKIVRRALEEPLRLIAQNAGVEGSIVVQEVMSRKGAQGYDAAAGRYTDLLKAGIIDPTKVTRTALQNAASVAGLLLMTEALVAEKPRPGKGTRRGMPDDMGGFD